MSADVAVVGFGPVGATLTGLLARRGLRVAVFDRSAEIFPLPRAFGLDHEAMRVFQALGIADRILPHTAEYRTSVYVGADGREIQRIVGAAPPYLTGWAPNYAFSQPAVERVLREAVGAMPGVSVELGAEVLRVEDAGSCASAEVRSADGAVRHHTAAYVVACDGASSPTRRSLGIELESLDFDEPWVVVDLLARETPLPSLPATNVQYCDPARPTTYVIGPGNHRRFELMVLEGELGEGDIPAEFLWRLLARWLKPDDAAIWRAAAYRFHALVAREWRRGRILLAGDSAHQTPPFIAQGMCQGIRDAANLAWKLELVLRRGVADALLDTYAAERRPHVVATTQIAKALGRVICERDPGAARRRDDRMLEEQGGKAIAKIRQDLIPGLTAGLLDGSCRAAGQIFPQPTVRHGGRSLRLDDLTGPCFRLVASSARDADLDPATRIALESVGGRVVMVDGAADVSGAITVAADDGLMSEWFARTDCTAALVRPDHYVYGTARGARKAAELVRRLALALERSERAPVGG